MSPSRLFQPLKIGNVELQNRIAMAPLTRYRADDNHVHTDLAVEYYGQRASVPGTLLITEATFISHQAGGYGNVPGIYNQAQIDSWRKVTDAVHAKGSFIFLQLWHLGRTADPKQAEKEGITIRSSSAEKLGQFAIPKAMTIDEIKETIGDYAQAARNAIAAGFDGVEIHGANGYLIDQFNQDVVNKRTDDYGGSIENRSRFALDVTKAVVDAVGADRTAIRLSPYHTFQGMRMEDPIPQFTDIVKKLSAFPLAYLHVLEPRVAGQDIIVTNDSLEPIIESWKGPILFAGGFKPDSAHKLVDEDHADREAVVVFGRLFISNPDLPFRIEQGLDLNEYNRDTFYLPQEAKGYTDYPFSKEFEKAA